MLMLLGHFLGCAAAQATSALFSNHEGQHRECNGTENWRSFRVLGDKSCPCDRVAVPDSQSREPASGAG